MKKMLGIVALVAAVSAPAMAESFYVGADAGQSKLSGEGSNTTDNAYSLFGGYQFDKPFSAELAYRDYGSISNDGADAKAHSWQASVVGSLPLSNDFSLTGRLGVADIKASGNDSFGDTWSDSRTRAVYGVGARYSINKEVGLRAEYTRAANIDNMNLSTLTVGVDYRF